MVDVAHEHAVRAAAFRHLEGLCEIHGDVLPWSLLKLGFPFQGRQIHLVAQQGIFKPKELDVPLAIRTTAPDARRGRPYDDGFTDDNRILYRYRGTDPHHWENVGLREAWRLHLPLVYFHGIVEGRYLTSWPLYIEADDPGNLVFTLRIAQHLHFVVDGELPTSEEEDLERRYGNILTRRRLHQQAFRLRVMAAYREQCAICQLKHVALLDAAHIIPDNELRGEPHVANGLSLCKIHHAAFDHNIIGISPDYVVRVRDDILQEEDGPMLKHGLVGANGQSIYLPHRLSDRPDRDRLALRFEKFKKAM